MNGIKVHPVNGTVSALSLQTSEKPVGASLRSFFSYVSDRSEDRSLIRKNKHDYKIMAKMMIVMALPILSLIIITSVALSKAQSHNIKVKQAQEALLNSIAVANVIGAIQRERGRSAIYLSSQDDQQAYEQLKAEQIATDRIMGRLQGNLSTFTFELHIIDNILITLDNFTAVLYNHRIDLLRGEVDILETIQFFSSINEKLMEIMTANIVLPSGKDLWKTFISITSLLPASESIGIQRATGGTYYNYCNIPGKGYQWMIELQIQEEIYLETAMRFHPELEVSYVICKCSSFYEA